MAERPRCEDLREPLAELALGIASGEQRARVLEHAAGCPDCRRLLGELTRVGDELLQLAPEHEPPAGFELRVLERLAPAPIAAGSRAPGCAAAAPASPWRSPRRSRAAPAPPPACWSRRTTSGSSAASSRAVLTRANGTYIAVTELRDPGGRERGLVFHYGGKPSWVFVTLDRPLPPGRYVASLVTRAGATSELGTFDLGGGDLSLGTTTRLDLLGVTQLRLRDERGGPVYVARFQ